MHMGDCCTSSGGCCESQRSFFTKEERTAQLKTYQESLERELQGVKERIADLHKKP